MTALLHISNNEGVETDRITWRAGAEVFSSGIVWKGFGNTDIILSFLKRSISPGKYR
jgi:trehalose utilization protein